ncbi:MAG: hypothetical protein CO032_01375, partial [Nitrosopumilales archaeon CG_4_9_14_0_2_um_filter_34_16]
TEEKVIEQKALKALNEIKAGADFIVVAHREEEQNSGKAKYEEFTLIPQESIKEDIRKVIVDLNTNELLETLVKTGGLYKINEQGEAIEETGLTIVKLLNKKNDKYSFQMLTYSTVPDPWIETGLNENHLLSAEVQLDLFYEPYIYIEFDTEGSKLFEDITERNIGKPLAIFIDDELISAPNVNEKITGGAAVIMGQFTEEEANKLAARLNEAAKANMN